MTKETQILPCPFCGGAATAVTGPIKETWGVTCIQCDCWCDYRAKSADLAIAEWNTRTPAIADGVGVEAVGWYHACVEGSSFHDTEEQARRKQANWGGYVYPLVKGTPPQAATDEGVAEEPCFVTPYMQNPCPEDLLFRLDYWGNFDYKTGCEYAHQILLDYRDVIFAALKNARSTPPQAAGADPDMPTQQLRLHFGELTNNEIRLVRAAIRFANRRIAIADGVGV